MNACVLRRDARTASLVEQALGLPGPNWTEVVVNFGSDEFATATVTMTVSRGQLLALVAATTPLGE